MAKTIKAEDYIGEYFKQVTLETCREDRKGKSGITRPRIRPVNAFESTLRVEFSRKLRELFPIGTRYIATVKVCQQSRNGQPYGNPYLSASEIALTPESVPDKGLVAQVKSGSISGLAYEYKFDETF